MLDSVARFEEKGDTNMSIASLLLERTQNKGMGKSRHSSVT